MTRLLLVCALFLAGCAAQPAKEVVRVPVEVKVPVYVQAAAPGELKRPYVPVNIPEFVSPQDKSAIVALTPDGLDSLKVILRTLVTRDKAWREWANKEATVSKQSDSRTLTAEPGE